MSLVSGLPVDVVVPSFGRADVLPRCLAALHHQLVRPARVVVVVRPQDHATLEVLEAWTRWPALQVVVVDRLGLVHAMGAGAGATSAPVVAFTDDDAEPHVDWIERIGRSFDRRPELGALGGRDLLPDGTDDLAEQVGTIDRWGRQHGNHHRGGGLRREVLVLKGVNLAVRRSMLAVPRTEAFVGDGAQVGSEWWICEWVRDQGGRVEFDPALLVDHHVGERQVGHHRVRPSAARVEANAANALRAPSALRPRRRAMAHRVLVGDHVSPGLVRGAVAVLRGERDVVALVRPTWRGHRAALAAVRTEDGARCMATADELRGLGRPWSPGPAEPTRLEVVR